MSGGVFQRWIAIALLAAGLLGCSSRGGK
ncbi:MprA protease, GlyGly-CTERM protein-sorting domain-containing form [Dongshaea marina]